MSRRVPQLTDDVAVRVTFPAETEGWADDLLGQSWMNFEVWRDGTDELVVEALVSGNTNGVSVTRLVLSEIEEALDEGDVDPMGLTISVRSVEAKA